MAKAPGILIIVENLTLPLDRRVWTEASTLRDAGYTVSIVCPKGSIYTAPYELLEGIHIFRHPMPYEADGALGYAFEYSWAIAWEFALSIKAYFKVGFDVVQACNPPDLLFVIGAFWKYLFGKRFIFDHHDINPELFEVKFGKKGATTVEVAGNSVKSYAGNQAAVHIVESLNFDWRPATFDALIMSAVLERCGQYVQEDRPGAIASYIDDLVTEWAKVND